jgi:hypothetical protein
MKRILVAASMLCAISGAALAQSLYVGGGVALTPSEPDFTQDALVAPMVGFDFPQLWRVSFMSTDAKNKKTDPDTKMHTNLLGVQRLFVYPFNTTFSGIGALGAGWYMVSIDGSGDGNGAGLGLMADASLRWSISKALFVDFSFQFRDAGVQISASNKDYTVDGGWFGAAAAVGWNF